MMAIDALQAICADLEAEHDELDALLATLDEDAWLTPTPADGWDVRDQIGHLAFFDEVAVIAVSRPQEFAEMLAGGDATAQLQRHLERARSMAGAEVLAWWRSARTSLLSEISQVDAKARVPWFGPPMSPRSFVTARLMETWAHGQDVYDALGASRQPTERLRHVCHIGVLALPWSFRVRGLPQPDGALRVALTGPSGDQWTWGPDDATDVIRGPALDFALLVTQRRHRSDTSLEASGALAEAFLDIAQAFAGPPGPGRQPLA